MGKRYRKKEYLFFKEKPYRILKHLAKEEISYASFLAASTSSTYTHVVHILQEFEKLGLIQTQWDGRTKLVKITKDGGKLFNSFNEIENTFKDLQHVQKKIISESESEINKKLEKLIEIEKKLKKIEIDIVKSEEKVKYVDRARKIGAYKKQLSQIQSENEDVLQFKNRVNEYITSLFVECKKMSKS